MHRRPLTLLAGTFGGLLLTVLLGGCGGGAAVDAGATHPGARTSPTRAAQPITARPMTGTAVSGSGYRFVVPRTWQDVTARLDRDDVDLAAAAKVAAHGFTSNVNVVVTDSRVEPGQLTTVVARMLDQMKASSPGYRVLAPRTVAGVRAGHLAGIRSQDGTSYWLEQYVFARGEHTYIVSFSFSPKVAAGTRTKAVESMLASWHWR